MNIFLKNKYNKRWLMTRGGRTEYDVIIGENGGLCVLMSSGSGPEREVYLPFDEPVHNYIGQPGDGEWIVEEIEEIVNSI